MCFVCVCDEYSTITISCWYGAAFLLRVLCIKFLLRAEKLRTGWLQLVFVFCFSLNRLVISTVNPNPFSLQNTPSKCYNTPWDVVFFVFSSCFTFFAYTFYARRTTHTGVCRAHFVFFCYLSNLYNGSYSHSHFVAKEHLNKFALYQLNNFRCFPSLNKRFSFLSFCFILLHRFFFFCSFLLFRFGVAIQGHHHTILLLQVQEQSLLSGGCFF